VRRGLLGIRERLSRSHKASQIGSCHQFPSRTISRCRNSLKEGWYWHDRNHSHLSALVLFCRFSGCHTRGGGTDRQPVDRCLAGGGALPIPVLPPAPPAAKSVASRWRSLGRSSRPVRDLSSVSKMRWFHIYLATMFTVSAAAVVLAFLIVGPHQL